MTQYILKLHWLILLSHFLPSHFSLLLHRSTIQGKPNINQEVPCIFWVFTTTTARTNAFTIQNTFLHALKCGGYRFATGMAQIKLESWNVVALY